MLVSRKNFEYIISYFITIAIMILIFCLSAQSAVESEALSGILIKDNFLEFLHHHVRKAAHFAIYAMLGVSVFISVGFSAEKKLQQFIISVFLCFLYGVFDEVHQLFVEGRAGLISDVIIDTVGAAFGAGSSIVFSAVMTKITMKLHDNRRSPCIK